MAALDYLNDRTDARLAALTREAWEAIPEEDRRVLTDHMLARLAREALSEESPA